MSEQRKALDALREELRERIEANERRFDDPYYRIEGVFQPADADWPGDKEGRALLAYVSHYRIFGRGIRAWRKCCGSCRNIPMRTFISVPRREREFMSSSFPVIRGFCAVFVSITSNSKTHSHLRHCAL